MEPIKRQLFEARAEISRLQSVADSNSVFGMQAQKRIEELEAELAQCLTVHAKLNDENQQLEKQVEELKAEIRWMKDEAMR